MTEAMSVGLFFVVHAGMCFMEGGVGGSNRVATLAAFACTAPLIGIPLIRVYGLDALDAAHCSATN